MALPPHIIMTLILPSSRYSGNRFACMFLLKYAQTGKSSASKRLACRPPFPYRSTRSKAMVSANAVKGSPALMGNPPVTSKLPARATRLQMARWVLPALEPCTVGAALVMNAPGVSCPHIWAAASILSAGTQVISSTFSGVKSCT